MTVNPRRLARGLATKAKPLCRSGRRPSTKVETLLRPNRIPSMMAVRPLQRLARRLAIRAEPIRKTSAMARPLHWSGRRLAMREEPMRKPSFSLEVGQEVGQEAGGEGGTSQEAGQG